MEINIAALRADVYKYIKSFGEKYTSQAAEKFTEAARETIIDVFYGAYSPMYYHRTDDLANNSYYKYKHNNGSKMYGGVVISSRDMSDYSNSWQSLKSVTPASDVVSWTWSKGYHGYLDKDPSNAIYTFPPISSLEMRIGEIIPQIESEALSYAKSQSYSVLQF